MPKDLTRAISRSVAIKASHLHPNPWNPYAKKSDRLQDAIAESIGEFDQIQDVVVRPHPDKKGHYQILDGEGRHRTFHGSADVYCTIVEGLTDAEAKKITIVMDETRAQADKIELAALLSELSNDYDLDELIKGLPYDNAHLEELIALDQIDWTQMGEGEGGDDNPVQGDAKPVEDEAPENSHISPDGSMVVSLKLSPALLASIDQAKQMINAEWSDDFGENLCLILEELTSLKAQEGMDGF